MEGAKFCASCGSPVVSKRFCIQCGKEIVVEGKFCSFCGAPQEPQSSKASAPSDSAQNDMDEAKAEASSTESKEDDSIDDNDANSFIIINENGKQKDVALYVDEKGLFVKGSAVSDLKRLGIKKSYICSNSGIVKSYGDIAPTPASWLDACERGSNDIVGKRKRGEDNNGDLNANIFILDELLK